MAAVRPPFGPPFEIYSPGAQSLDLHPVVLEGTPPTPPFETEFPLALPPDEEGDGFYCQFSDFHL